MQEYETKIYCDYNGESLLNRKYEQNNAYAIFRNKNDHHYGERKGLIKYNNLNQLLEDRDGD